MNENMLHATMLIIVLLVIFLKTDNKWKETAPFDIIAHRGASFYAPEHTSAAFDLAIDMQADYIEMDIQMSRDGNLVVLHDVSVERTTNGTGFVKDLTMKQLKQLDAGSWFHSKFQQERILTLQEVFNKYSKKVKLLIEIKNPDLYPNIEKKLVKLIKKQLEKGISPDTFIIQSFDIQLMKRMKKLLPMVPTALLLNVHSLITDDYIKEWSSFVEYINVHYLTVNKDIVKTAHRYGLHVYPWGVDYREVALLMADYQADGIITNNPLIFEGRQNSKSIISPSVSENLPNQIHGILSWFNKRNLDELFSIVKLLADALQAENM